ncbi:MAG: bifunctional glutamate N-acetyltransferase/amino-acid acetyltransferase ArgJ [Solirubrobacteraceae bacterium]
MSGPLPPEGAASPGGATGPVGTASQSFFSSRWVERPGHVTELGGGLPAGFRAAGVAAGLKPSGRPDLALLVSDAPGTASAARFTASGTAAAPVLLTRERCRLDGLRAVAANAGCANAATGARGYEDAARMQAAAAQAVGLEPAQVALASTGGIREYLPMEAIESGIAQAAAALRQDGDGPLSGAIRTTDAFEKRASLEVTLPSGAVRLSAQAKGAGMIQPHFATMFCFVQTDAMLLGETADLLLGVCVKRSFDRISVDGQLSTNDIAILMASGASGVRVEPESEDELRLGEALDALLRQLALLIVKDGEGARRIARVVVSGGHDLHVEGAARAVANSPLVKAALHGGDPNWGRIVAAVGMALPGTAPLALDVAIEGVQVCTAGASLPYDEPALAAAVARDEVSYRVDLPGEGHEAEVFFSDLSHEYVTINADYTT